VNNVTTIRARVSEHDDEANRADTRGLSVTVLEGKAADLAHKKFFGEQVPAVRGEKVVDLKAAPSSKWGVL
jgi:hypothetical protein